MFSKRIEEARTIAIGGHVRPDGDCTGSCMGMYNYLREKLPKTVDVYLEEIPEAYTVPCFGNKKIRLRIPKI
ncbi:MAG: DHH family phosphoesterase [Lachnospiraceae bacterium]